MRYLIQVLIAVDQLASALTGGWADETISSRLYRLEQQGSRVAARLRQWVDAAAHMLFDQEQHCFKSYQEERARAQFPPDLRV